MVSYPDIKNKTVFELAERVVSSQDSGIVLLGITGAGGAGKTTFARNLVKYFGIDKSLTIDLDDYLFSRIQRGKLEVTGYNPQANQLGLARSHIEALVRGEIVEKPRYDHASGDILSNETVEPKSIVIIEGVTTLYPELRELYTASFFLDASEETQIKSRIERDVNTRGYSLEEALALFEAIKPDFERFIAPTRPFASVIVSVNTDYVMIPVHIDEMLR